MSGEGLQGTAGEGQLCEKRNHLHIPVPSLLTCRAGLAVRLTGGTGPGPKGALGTWMLRAEGGPWRAEVASRAQLRSLCSRTWGTRAGARSGGTGTGNDILHQLNLPCLSSQTQGMGKHIPWGRRIPMDSSGVWQVTVQNLVLQNCFCADQRQWKPKIMIYFLRHLYQASGSTNSLKFRLRKKSISPHR